MAVQTAHSSAHPAEHADTGSDPVKTFVLATRMDRYGQAVRLGYHQVQKADNTPDFLRCFWL